MPNPPDAPAGDDLLRDALYYRLFDEAERVRWRMDAVPFHAIDPARATPALRALVREAAASELTTHSASRKFLAEFADDVDFTQWISVWFYEESRHPAVLMRYLDALGERFDARFVQRGRLATPLMRSRFGTLATNVISEMVASAAYMHLARTAGEPVLARIARDLAADEARHASGFYAYARRTLERSKEPDADRATALKVLYLWLRDAEHVGHPVNQFHERRSARAEADEAATGERAIAADVRSGPVRARICRMIGTLVDLPVTCAEDALAQVKALAPR